MIHANKSYNIVTNKFYKYNNLGKGGTFIILQNDCWNSLSTFDNRNKFK